MLRMNCLVEEEEGQSRGSWIQKDDMQGVIVTKERMEGTWGDETVCSAAELLKEDVGRVRL